MGQTAILSFIALGGAVGACSRYLISELCLYLFGRGFPYGTLTVNILGSLIMGALTAAMASGYITVPYWRHMIGLGFLGALTTFSTFSMDNILLLQQQAFLKMGVNILFNVSLSLCACWIGFYLVSKS